VESRVNVTTGRGTATIGAWPAVPAWAVCTEEEEWREASWSSTAIRLVPTDAWHVALTEVPRETFDSRVPMGAPMRLLPATMRWRTPDRGELTVTGRLQFVGDGPVKPDPVERVSYLTDKDGGILAERVSWVIPAHLVFRVVDPQVTLHRPAPSDAEAVPQPH
jgi:hypothetical protein